MKGFKDSTKTVYTKGGPAGGSKGAAKVAKVMREFKEGTLHSGSKEGPKVRNPKQAVAIALSEARRGAKTKYFSGGEVLTKAERNELSPSKFGLPGSRRFPMPDKSHAANAKARATQMVNAGKLSESSKAKIDAKADKILKKAEGGRVTPAEAVHKHERHLHPGKPLTKLANGGRAMVRDRGPLIKN
jgi:hypothetical protein